MHVEEVNNKYFLVKKAIYSDHTPNPEKVENYEFWALLKQNEIKYTIDPQNIILEAKKDFPKTFGASLLHDSACNKVIQYQRKNFETKILHKLEEIKLTDAYTQTYEEENF